MFLVGCQYIPVFLSCAKLLPLSITDAGASSFTAKSSRVSEEYHSTSLGFLSGGGEMGALMRAHHWETTSLGIPQSWPQPLRTAIRLILNTGHPMYVWWGPELLCFYNDAGLAATRSD
jgi:hypothetical protein